MYEATAFTTCKVNGIAKSASAWEAGEMSPAPSCRFLQLIQCDVCAVEVTP